MKVKINEAVSCKFYDLELDQQARAIHEETMRVIISKLDGGYLRGGGTSPRGGSSRVRFFLESDCVEFYERAMAIYQYNTDE